VSLFAREYRNASRAAILVVIGAMASASCGHAAHPSQIELLREWPHAERRAAGHIDEAVRIDGATAGGQTRMAIVMRAPARITYPVQLPETAHLDFSLMLLPDAAHPQPGVVVRVGISDNRYYNELLKEKLTSVGETWRPISVDLSPYSGFKWSVFYHPSHIAWKLIINVDAAPGGAVALAEPVINFGK
jgi:hypothetical protein